jgi:hypothetical protein
MRRRPLHQRKDKGAAVKRMLLAGIVVLLTSMPAWAAPTTAPKAAPAPAAPAVKPDALLDALRFTSNDFADFGQVAVMDQGRVANAKDAFSFALTPPGAPLSERIMGGAQRFGSAAEAQAEVNRLLDSFQKSPISRTAKVAVVPVANLGDTCFAIAAVQTEGPSGTTIRQYVVATRQNVELMARRTLVTPQGAAAVPGVQDMVAVVKRMDDKVVAWLAAPAAAAPVVAVEPAAPTPAPKVATEPAAKTKLPGLVDALQFTAKEFEDLGERFLRQGPNAPDKFTTTALVSLPASRGDLGLTIKVERFATAADARADMTRRLQAPPPGVMVIPPFGPINTYAVPLAGAGDACFVYGKTSPPGIEGMYPMVAGALLARNNVLVEICANGASIPQMRNFPRAWDMPALARRMDNRIVTWLGQPAKPVLPAGAVPLPSETSIDTKELATVKVPGVVTALQFDAKEFSKLGSVKVLETEKGPKDVFAFYVPRGGPEGQAGAALVSVVVTRLGSPAEAKTLIKDALDNPRAVPLRRETGGRLAEIGDCIVIGAGEVQFARNNVHVLLSQTGSGAIDLPELALQIDQRLLHGLPVSKERTAAINDRPPPTPRDSPEHPVKAKGDVQALKFTLKDFEDLNLAPIGAPSPEKEWPSAFGFSVGRAGKPFSPDDARLEVVVTRCATPRAAQDLLFKYIQCGKSTWMRGWTDTLMGDVCYLVSEAPPPAIGKPPALAIVFCRNNVHALVYAADGAMDQKLAETVAQRIARELLSWVKDTKEPDQPVAVKQLPAALPPGQATALVADLLAKADQFEKAEKLPEALAQLEEIQTRVDPQYWPKGLEGRTKALKNKVQALDFFFKDKKPSPPAP